MATVHSFDWLSSLIEEERIQRPQWVWFSWLITFLCILAFLVFVGPCHKLWLQKNLRSFLMPRCTLAHAVNNFLDPQIVSSDRSSYSDDVIVYIQLGRPLFEILSIYAFLIMLFSFLRVTRVSSITLLVHWSISPLDHWSIVPSFHRSIGPLVECQMSYVICQISNVKCQRSIMFVGAYLRSSSGHFFHSRCSFYLRRVILGLWLHSVWSSIHS